MRQICILLFFITITSTFDQRIINGKDAQLGQFPWQVLIISATAGWEQHFCSGAIIHEKWVLTTARCVYGVYELGIRAGTVSINYQNTDVIAVISWPLIVHEEFDISTLKNDIALIPLTYSLELNDNIKPINLPENDIVAGVSATVSGWGHSSHDDDDFPNITSILQYATVATIDNSECQRIYGGDVVTEGVVCTVGNGDVIESPCVGDGGALLVTDVETNPVLDGIFSFIGSPGCEQGLPAGYTRVAHYREWIRGKMGI